MLAGAGSMLTDDEPALEQPQAARVASDRAIEDRFARGMLGCLTSGYIRRDLTAGDHVHGLQLPLILPLGAVVGFHSTCACPAALLKGNDAKLVHDAGLVGDGFQKYVDPGYSRQVAVIAVATANQIDPVARAFRRQVWQWFRLAAFGSLEKSKEFTVCGAVRGFNHMQITVGKRKYFDVGFGKSVQRLGKRAGGIKSVAEQVHELCVVAYDAHVRFARQFDIRRIPLGQLRQRIVVSVAVDLCRDAVAQCGPGVCGGIGAAMGALT